MAKETSVIFLYDTELLKNEEDDPNSAILYFFPTYVSDTQKTALCGQLIGTVMCLRSILAMPKTVSLRSGKFVLIENGRYILVVGTDRNIPGYVLEHRANLVYCLVNFFHKDFVSLAQLYEGEKLRDKLYHIFDTYLKLLFLGGCIFSHLPLFDTSKVKIDILDKVKVFLDYCKTLPTYLGGMLLYYNKIIQTQLSSHTSKKIVLSDPFRIKNPAELTELTFDVPLAVKLFYVYIPNEEFQGHYEKSSWGLDFHNTTSVDNENHATLKRDTSLLFTVVPEDGTVPPTEVVQKSKGKRSRPNSLNLKNYSLDSFDIFDKGKTPITPYWSQPSSISTPLTETKSFVSQTKMQCNMERIWKLAVCCKNLTTNNSFNEQEEQNCVRTSTKVPEKYFKCFRKAEKVLEFVQTALEKARMRRTHSLKEIFCKHSITNNLHQYQKKSINLRRCKSIHDPLFPWSMSESVVSSQYYIEDVLDKDFSERRGCSYKELIAERKKSLTLPIKPHNASEAQKTDMKSPGGYSTPLMNKLTVSRGFEKQRLLNDIPSTSLISKDNQKTETLSELIKCVLFMYGEKELVVASLLTEDCLKGQRIVEKLHHLCIDRLPSLEKELKACPDLSKCATSPNSSPYSILNIDKEWGTLKKSGLWTDLSDLTQLHEDFAEHEDLTEFFLRKPDSVLYGHHAGETEIFYQEAATSVNGLLPPNDPLGNIRQTAKKRLEKYHDVFIN